MIISAMTSLLSPPTRNLTNSSNTDTTVTMKSLPQLNLAILFGQKGRLPVYFQRLPGNITDVTTLHGLLKTFKTLEMKTFHYVMDKGFYSKKNVDELLTSRDKFILSVPLNNKWVQHAIDDIHEVIHGPEGYRKLDDETFMFTLVCIHGERKIVAATFIFTTTLMLGRWLLIGLMQNW